MDPDRDPGGARTGAVGAAVSAGRPRGRTVRARFSSKSSDGFARALPVATVGALALAFAVVFFRLAHMRHSAFGTFGFDLGIYDQGTWLVARGHSPFVTVRGIDLFGHHVNAILLLVAPFYRLGAGPDFLLAVQVLSQASGAFAVYLLARDRIGGRWPGVVLAAVLLLNPTYQWLVWEFFHPDALAIAPLLFAYWAARQRRWGWFALAAGLALACKEDVSLALLVVGLLVAGRTFFGRTEGREGGPRSPGASPDQLVLDLGDRENPPEPGGAPGPRRLSERWIGGLIALGAGAWFLFATRVLIPWRNGIGPFYDAFFGDLGDSPGEVLSTIVRHPSRAWRLVVEHDRLTWYLKSWGPVAFLPAAAPEAFAIALPMTVVNVLTAYPYTRDFRFHYSSIVVAGTIVATVEAIARISRSVVWRRNLLLGVVLVAAVWTSHLWGISPLGRDYDAGFWPLQQNPRTEVKERAVAAVSDGGSTSAMYNLVPHLAHRRGVYEFPVPWCNVNWGVEGENLDDPASVEWLAVDRTLVGERDRRLLDDLLATEFEVRFDEADLVVARRIAPSRSDPEVPPVGYCRPRRGVDLED